MTRRDRVTAATGIPRIVTFRYIVKGIVFLMRRFPACAVVILVFSVLSGVIPACNAWVAKEITDNVVERIKSTDPMREIQVLGMWVGAAVGLGLLAILVKWRQTLAQDWLQKAGAVEIDRILVDRTQAIDVLTRESPEFADRQMLVQMGTGALSSNLFTSAIGIGQTLITMVSFAGILVAFSPGLALLGVAIGASFGVIEVRYSKRRYLLSRALVKVRRKLTAVRALLTNPHIVHEIRRPDTYQRLRTRMLRGGSEVRDRQHELERRTHLRRTAVGAVEVLISFAVYSGLLWRFLKGAITLGDVILYRNAFTTVSRGVQSIGRSGSMLLESDLQLQHMFEFMEPSRTDVATVEGGKLPFPSRLEQGMEIRGLHFKYPNMDRPVFENFNLTLLPGEITALVGPNGSGKTTLLKILAGIYPASSGNLTLEGRDLCEYSLDDYMSSVYMWGLGSWVHPLTARDNIALCRLSARDNDEQVWEAARRAGVDEIVAGLPLGMDTMLTRLLDGGQQLSWGQNMRIILARALFARANIILIDEPGAGLDRKSRLHLLDLIRGLRDDRIIVVASHDPEVIGMADRATELE